jgi:uncharacterized protein YwqG
MKDEIIKRIYQYGPQHLAPAIVENIKESLLIRTHPLPEDQIPLGETKIGGKPDLPSHFGWPVWHNTPLSFIAQINLGKLPEYDFLNILPNGGVMSFFYSAGQETWGFDPKDKGSWQVLHLNDNHLQRRDYPIDLPDEGKYESCMVEFQHSITIPALESPYFDFVYRKSNLEEIDQYLTLEEKVNEFLNEGDSINRLLGHPDQQQNDMQTECQLVSHDLYCGDRSGYEDPKAYILKPGAIEWELLLQIASDENAKMMWGDVGSIYFWIQRKDLLNKNFEATWLILQCG